MPRTLENVSHDTLDLRMSREQHPRDIAIANLKATAPRFNSLESEVFKGLCVILEYFSNPDNRGAKKGGSEARLSNINELFTWDNVPLRRVVDDAEKWIERKVEKSRRTEVWHTLHKGIPCSPRTPTWDNPPLQDIEHRTSPRRSTGNVELINTFANVTEQEVEHIGPYIMLYDPYFETRTELLRVGYGKARVSGGRLAHDFDLEDIPRHYICHQIRQWIGVYIARENRGLYEQAVFHDVMEENFEAKSEPIRRGEDQLHNGNELAGHESKRPTITSQSRNKSDLEVAIEEIDSECDLTEHEPGFSRQLLRKRVVYKEGHTNSRSCILPRHTTMEKEKGIFTGDRVKYDADQIRAMIARLVKYSDWTIEDFRKAMPEITRKALMDFLQRRGRFNGTNCLVFRLAWEFFRKREILNVPLPGKPPSPQPKKRKREALAEQSVNIVAKASKRMKQEQRGPPLLQPATQKASKQVEDSKTPPHISVSHGTSPTLSMLT